MSQTPAIRMSAPKRTGRHCASIGVRRFPAAAYLAAATGPTPIEVWNRILPPRTMKTS